MMIHNWPYLTIFSEGWFNHQSVLVNSQINLPQWLGVNNFFFGRSHIVWGVKGCNTCRTHSWLLWRCCQSNRGSLCSLCCGFILLYVWLCMYMYSPLNIATYSSVSVTELWPHPCKCFPVKSSVCQFDHHQVNILFSMSYISLPFYRFQVFWLGNTDTQMIT